MRILLTLALLFTPITALSAQEATPLDPGTRIRVTVVSPTPRVQIGTYSALTATTLHLETRAQSLAIPVGAVRRLEMSRGRKANVFGGVLGFLVGGAAGGVVGCLANKDDYGVFCAGQDDTKVFAGAALGGVAVGTLGAVLFRRERWSAVDLARLGAR